MVVSKKKVVKNTSPKAGSPKKSKREAGGSKKKERSKSKSKATTVATKVPILIQMQPQEPLGIGIRKILTDEVNRINSWLMLPETEIHTQIHETRRILKRIRALIWLMEPDIGIYNCQRETAVYRDIGRKISSLRSLFVNMETLEKLKQELPGKFIEGPLKRTEQLLKKQYKTEVRKALHDRDLLNELKKDIETALKSAGELPVIHDDLKIPLHSIRASFKAGRKCWRKVARKANSINIHELRKETKNLQFQLQLMELLDPHGIHRWIEPLRRLAQYCGTEHDYYELMLFIRKNLPQEELKKELLFRINRKMAAYRKQILPLSRKIFGTRSKKFIAGIHLTQQETILPA